MNSDLKHKILHITVAGFATVMCFLLSCSSEKDLVPLSQDKRKVPTLTTLDVSTVVSDSGVTRYRVESPEWLMFDKADTVFWEFPKGIMLEKFDPQMKVDAKLQSKYAIYYKDLKLWDLRDSVVALNLEGEKFECDQLFWNQETEKVYSDGKIRITQQDKIIDGLGFESNQALTKYTILKPVGIFPISDED